MTYIVFAGMRSEDSWTFAIPCLFKRKAQKVARQVRRARGFGVNFTPYLQLPITDFGEGGTTYANIGRVPLLTWLSLIKEPSGMVPEASWKAEPIEEWFVHT